MLRISHDWKKLAWFLQDTTNYSYVVILRQIYRSILSTAHREESRLLLTPHSSLLFNPKMMMTQFYGLHKEQILENSQELLRLIQTHYIRSVLKRKKRLPSRLNFEINKWLQRLSPTTTLVIQKWSQNRGFLTCLKQIQNSLELQYLFQSWDGQMKLWKVVPDKAFKTRGSWAWFFLQIDKWWGTVVIVEKWPENDAKIFATWLDF